MKDNIFSNQNQHSSLKEATKDNPCPHCGKTDWCYSLGELTVCKRGFDPATGWIKTSKTDKGGDYFYAPERPDSSFTRNYSPRPSSPPQPPTIELARLPGQPKIPQSVTKGNQVITIYPYGPEHQIKRVETFEGGQRVKKDIYQYHRENNQMVPGKGDLPWDAYRIDEAIRYGKGKGVLGVEGEKCVEAVRENQIVAITLQGSNWTVDQITAMLLKLKIAGVSFFAYKRDHDDAGIKKAENVIEAGQRADFPVYLINPVELWSEMPEKGDIVDWIEGVELTPDERVKQLLKVSKLNCPQQQNIQSPPPRAKDNKAIKIAMERDRARQIIGEQLRFNERSKEIEIFSEELGIQGQRFELDYLEVDLAHYFGLGIEASKTVSEGIVRRIAEENAYDPVTDYLEQCAQQHSDTSIIDNLAEVLFGAAEPVAQAMLKKTLIAAVARTYNPGCKCDTATVLYSPKQGIGKSTTWKTLFGEEHYCEDVGDISNKDEVTKMRRGWGCELSEIARITRKQDADKVKQFLSTSVDWMRDPYGRSLQKNRRRGIIVGTTNSDDFMQDRTGNRRFWVIEVQKSVDIKWLEENRDKIWAAAVYLYRQGEIWWLTPEEEGQSRDINQGFMDALPFEDEILEIVSAKDKVATQQIVDSLVQRHGIKADTSRDRKDLELTIKKVLQQNGWIKPKSGRVTIDGKQYRGYERLDSLQDDSEDKRQEPSRGVVYAVTPISQESQLSLDGQTVKNDILQKTENPDTQPSPEPIQKQIQNFYIEEMNSRKQVSYKELLNRFPDHPDEVEAFLKRGEKEGRIYRKRGYIKSLSPRRLEKGDRVRVTEGEKKGYWGVVEQDGGINEEKGIHRYVVNLGNGVYTPGLYDENQLSKG